MGKSFYGGMDGRPFILKKIYQTIPEMINIFKNEINYGEYVLISNDNRNHPDNGKLFKRIYASTGEDIKAFIYEDNQFKNKTYENVVGIKYIGAIVGPQGSALEFKLFDKNEGLDSLKNSYEDSEFIETDSELILSPGENAELFPGEEGSVITLKAYSFRDKNGNKSTVYLDMSIPYNVIEWTTTQLNSQEEVSILESEIYPFYQSYNLGIPKGQDGTSFNNVRVIIPTADDNVVTISFDEDRNITATTYEGLQDDIDNQRQIWVADVIDYKVTDKGTKYLVYLGDYNIINDIMIDEEGTITIKYNHNDDSIWDKKLTWIEGASITNGHLDIKTNNEKNEIHKQLNWPINIAINPEDGAVTYTDVEVDENGNNKTYSQDSLTWVKNLTIGDTGLLNTYTTTGENQIENQQLHWVKNISINPNTGEITYTDVSGSTTTEILDWAKDININEEGTITINYTKSENKVIDKLIDWIKEVSISQDGTVSIESNNGTQLLSPDQQKLKWLENVSLAQDGTFTKTDNQNVPVDQEEKLKWVNGVSLSQDGTFTQSYNNGETTPQQTERLKWPINIQLNSEDGKVTTTYNDGSVDTTQNPQMDWIKSATLNDDKLLQIDYVNAEDISVNLKTPNQIELDEESGDLYATYNTGERMLLGNFGKSNPISATAIAEGEEEPANLMAGGILFITQDATAEE